MRVGKLQSHKDTPIHEWLRAIDYAGEMPGYDRSTHYL